MKTPTTMEQHLLAALEDTMAMLEGIRSDCGPDNMPMDLEDLMSLRWTTKDNAAAAYCKARAAITAAKREWRKAAGQEPPDQQGREWLIACHGMCDIPVICRGPAPALGEVVRVREIKP